jgi:protein-serine/threonine kinase
MDHPTPEVPESPKQANIRISAFQFQKIKLIGKGDVGKVYLVKHIETDKLYAMKILDKKEMIKRNKVKRVLTEREILATASHPFIVTLYWSFQSADKLYFIMDYCAGGEFFRMLQRQPGKCLTEDSVRFYSAEVLLALEYLHMMGFIYRDLKPENILVHETGHIMLTDFDLSKQAATCVNPQVIKKIFEKPEIYSKPELITNSFVGTAEYIAPEVIQGFGQSSSVDWWTFGILMYEMLYGVTPHRGKTQEETFNQILHQEVKFPEHHQYPVSNTCKSLIKKLLANDPKKRLGSVHGAADIKKHKFFDGKINFTLIRNITPPMVPKLAHPLDTSNFRNIPDDEEDWDAPEQQNEDPTNAFKDFTPITRPTKESHVKDS